MLTLTDEVIVLFMTQERNFSPTKSNEINILAKLLVVPRVMRFELKAECIVAATVYGISGGAQPAPL